MTRLLLFLLVFTPSDYLFSLSLELPTPDAVPLQAVPEQKKANAIEASYLRFFMTVEKIRTEAEQTERQGMNARYYRTLVQNRLGLTAKQASIVEQSAASFVRQFVQLYPHVADIHATMVHNPAGMAAHDLTANQGQTQMVQFQTQRSALVLSARDSLMSSLGRVASARLESAITTNALGKQPLLPMLPGTEEIPNRLELSYFVALFDAVRHFESLAQQERQHGNQTEAEGLATLVQRQSRLTAVQYRVLDSVATNFETSKKTDFERISAADLAYRKIALEQLAYHQQLSRTPALLKAWTVQQKAREEYATHADAAMQSLRTGLGDSAFESLNSFVKVKFNILPQKHRAGLQR